MLNAQENKLLDIFKEIYLMNINNYINENSNNLNIIFDNKHIPDKLIDIFLKKSKNYLNIILETSILYSLNDKTNNIKYKNFIEYYKEDINNLEIISNEFKRITVYNCIKFLIAKKNICIDLCKYEEFKEKNINMLIHIKNNIQIHTINDLEKNIIFKIMCKYNLADIEKTVKTLINTTTYDKDLILLSNNIINTDKDILYFKKYLVRKMIFDTYITEYNIRTKKSFITPLDIYIESCIENNSYYLPKDKTTLNFIINRYCHCFYHPEKEKEYIKNNDEKKLIKINPYYKLG